jgi:hypothetical protein
MYFRRKLQSNTHSTFSPCSGEYILIEHNLTMAPTPTISTPLPNDISPDAIIALLHDHETYIKLTCPQLISHKLESGDASASEPCVYHVVDRKPIGETTYTLTLTNTPEGIDSLVNAKPPFGTLIITTKWRIADGTLTETMDIEANMIMKKMIKGNLEKQHAEYHTELINMAKA